MSDPIPIRLKLPEIMKPLLHPYRYKILYGGRAGMRSWSIARAILFEAYINKTRVLCTREVQKSIKDSVHKLLEDQISLLGMDGFYRVLDTEIRGKNGSEIIFAGLADQTADSIKSYEGIDRCWCEEAHLITKRSWDILIPTIRKADSQILISFNPELETDETYQRFVKDPPVDSIVIFTTYKNNPWLSKELEAERIRCKQTNPEDYDNIWEGKCKPAVEGAIYYRQIQQADEQGRICNVPYNPMLRVHIVFDLGKGDSLFVAMVQKHLSAIMIIRCIAGTHFEMNTLSTSMKELRYNWGKVWLPHDGFTSTINARSSEQILKSLGWDVTPKDQIKQLSVEEGIRNTRMLFPQIYFDRTHCEPLIESLKRYRRHVSRSTGAATDPVHDNYSHGADCLRYIACNSDMMSNEAERRKDIDISIMYNPSDRLIGM